MLWIRIKEKSEMSLPVRPEYKVAIVLEKQEKTVNSWSSYQWELAAVLSDEDGPDSLQGPIVIRESQKLSQYLWKGLKIRLFVDASEGYWYNLLSDVPFAFVVCEADSVDDDVPVPLLVTVSQDEAGAHLETDSLVLSGPLPADIRDQTEQFVVNNYVPQVKKKRKRRNWYKESLRNQPPQNQD